MDLDILAEVSVSACRLRRLVQRIGQEREAQLRASSLTYQELPIPERKTCPIAMAPKVACIQCDGGRMQIRDEDWGKRDACSASSPPSFWRETKVATLLKMTSEIHEMDPCPFIPSIFVDPVRMQQLSREIKGFNGSKQVDKGETAGPQCNTTSIPIKEDELHASARPKLLVRSIVASRCSMDEFGKLVVGAAYDRGFLAAARKAFVCDGMACNWSIHEKYFYHFTPIVDFVHALCYIYHAAVAGRTVPEAWSDYKQWAQWLWGGQISELINAIEERQMVLGKPTTEEPETSPSNLVNDALTYMNNQRSRMSYPEYRRDGLPITSAYIESAIKQMNMRVKGTEKFWSENASEILQLRADCLSDTRPLADFWLNRPKTIPIHSYYKMAA